MHVMSSILSTRRTLSCGFTTYGWIVIEPRESLGKLLCGVAC